MSLLDGKRRFEQSSLSSRHLVKVHVDADEFLSLVREPVAPRDGDKKKTRRRKRRLPAET